MGIEKEKVGRRNEDKFEGARYYDTLEDIIFVRVDCVWVPEYGENKNGVE